MPPIVSTIMPMIQKARTSEAMRFETGSAVTDWGAFSGLRVTINQMAVMNNAVSNTPGTTPAMKRRPILSSVRMA